MSPSPSRAHVAVLALVLFSTLPASIARAAWPRDPNIGNVRIVITAGTSFSGAVVDKLVLGDAPAAT